MTSRRPGNDWRISSGCPVFLVCSVLSSCGPFSMATSLDNFKFMDTWPDAWSFPAENLIWIALMILLILAGVRSVIMARSNKNILSLQAVVVVAALGLLAYEWSYFGNRQAYGIQTSGRM